MELVAAQIEVTVAETEQSYMLEQLLRIVIVEDNKYWCEKPADAERAELSAFSCFFSELRLKKGGQIRIP